MIVVDDHVAGSIFGGDRAYDDIDVATTWGFHYRLLRALTDRRVSGTLSRATPERMLGVARAPEDHGVRIVDPRPLTATAAELSIIHRLNLLTAELAAAAVVHDAKVVLTERNVGRRWPALFDELGITLTVV